LLVELLKERETEDVFEYVLRVLESVRKKGKIPVLILDELQVIGDLKIDDILIYRLFNFFITITKRLHLAHVFAVTSDSLFIERVYSEAMLQGRCRYLLVDDFDYETTKGFLRKYGFSDGEIKLVWEYFGGKPVYLVEAVKNRHRLKEFCEEQLRIRTGQIEEIVFKLEIENKKLFKEVVELLKEIERMERVRYRFVTDAISFLVRNNVVFADPTVKVVRPQSKLDLLAIKNLEI
jgi:AAA+ ATPase superfamily predicted ATPase